ncbi:hypothetical protein [Synechocystis sp. PCC 7509]|uniref:hypothetical protein n=1 Tax=Synechocystis sp. PCC 7509 TaxID=927677 RepID=UPI0002ABB684|nr:hypothetical protein [Synechocystis sp. PCC 7509]
MKYLRPQLTFIFLIASIFISGCTPEKARALRLAAIQFKVESLAAIQAIEQMHQREIASPPLSQTELRNNAIDNILTSKKEIFLPQDLDFLIDPDKPQIDPQAQVAWQAFINKMNTQYTTLAAIYDEVENGSLLATDAVKKSAEHARILTLQMAAFATVIDKHPPILLQDRIVVIADIDTLRKQYQQKRNEGEPDENLQLLKDKAGELYDQWQQIAVDEQKLRETTLAQCLKAAILGKELTQLIERYNKINLDDLNSIIARVLDTTAAITGQDYAALKTRATNVFAEIKNDPIWSKAADTALAEVNNAVANRNPPVLDSQPSANRRVQSSSWLQINDRILVANELRLLSRGIVVNKNLGVEASNHYYISPQHQTRKQELVP